VPTVTPAVWSTKRNTSAYTPDLGAIGTEAVIVADCPDHSRYCVLLIVTVSEEAANAGAPGASTDPTANTTTAAVHHAARLRGPFRVDVLDSIVTTLPSDTADSTSFELARQASAHGLPCGALWPQSDSDHARHMRVEELT
jgi:hypothetical protein